MSVICFPDLYFKQLTSKLRLKADTMVQVGNFTRSAVFQRWFRFTHSPYVRKNFFSKINRMTSALPTAPAHARRMRA